MMNDDKNYFGKLPASVKKYTIGLSCCFLVFALFAFIAANVNKESETVTKNTTTQVAEVEAEVTNVPDTRHYETIIVPATQITTIPVSEETILKNSSWI